MLGRYYQAAVAVSRIEAEEVRNTSPVPVSVIPTCVDTTVTAPGPEQPGPPRLVFTALAWLPAEQPGDRLVRRSRVAREGFERGAGAPGWTSSAGPRRGACWPSTTCPGSPSSARRWPGACTSTAPMR